MSWDAISALAEVFGAVAVVISLIYLGQQVRQNTNVMRTANANTVQVNFQQLARTFYGDTERAAFFLRAMSDPSGLTPEERLSAYAWFFDFPKTAELAYYQYLRGELDAPLWEASLSFYKAYFSTPGFKLYWEERQNAFVPEFRNAMKEWAGSPGPLKRPDTLVRNTV